MVSRKSEVAQVQLSFLRPLPQESRTMDTAARVPAEFRETNFFLDLCVSYLLTVFFLIIRSSDATELKMPVNERQ